MNTYKIQLIDVGKHELTISAENEESAKTIANQLLKEYDPITSKMLSIRSQPLYEIMMGPNSIKQIK